MAFIPVTNAAQVELRGTYLNEPVENTLWFEHDGGITEGDLIALTDHMIDWWDTLIKPITSLSGSLRSVYARDHSTVAGVVHENTVGLPIAGTVVGAAEPGNVSLCVSFRTPVAGRSFRGRNFTWGLVDGHTNGNTVDSGYAASVQAAYDALRTGPLPTGWTWVVVSRRFNKLPRLLGVKVPITSVIITDLNLDSQRGRLAGR